MSALDGMAHTIDCGPPYTVQMTAAPAHRTAASASAKAMEEQKQSFVEALGAKLVASFQPPEGGIAAPKHERARFTAVARAAIERLPTATPLRGQLLEDFEAISVALWEQYVLHSHGLHVLESLL